MHKFWVNCVSYENLHLYIERYIRIMIDNHDYYFDGGSSDENPMSTGGYAVLALALNVEEYAKLLEDYLEKNKSYDHNVLTDAAIEAYIAKWGVIAQNFETVLVCMEWYDRLNPKKTDFSGFKAAEILKMLNTKSDVKDYVLKRIVDYTWGGNKGLQKEISSAADEIKEEMQKLLDKNQQ